MTGYGRGESSRDGFKVTIEVSSVNRKQGEVVVYLPRELEPLEPRVRDLANRRIARGRLVVKVSLQANEQFEAGQAQINFALAKAYAREIGKLAKELHLHDAVTLESLLRIPGVLRTDDAFVEAEPFWPEVEKALENALETLVRMRKREGSHLSKDLVRRMATMRKSTERIRRAAPEMVSRYREQLRERIAKAGLEVPPLDDERLVKEVVYFADRSDISEEVTRLESHCKQFDDCLKSEEPIGRTLDFLAQEMNREMNTIGSKAADSAISREVVALKAELEKFREQEQNIE